MGDSAYAKVSVSLPHELVASARKRAGARGLSAYVAEGLRLAEHLADLDEFLALHVTTHGPVPEDVMEEVRQAWPDPSARGQATPRRRGRSSSTATG